MRSRTAKGKWTNSSSRCRFEVHAREEIRAGMNKLSAVSFAALWLCATYALAGEAPVAGAAEKEDRVKIEALLSSGADVTAGQADGMTALHWAAYLDNFEVAQLLLKAGADAKIA